MPGGSGSRSRSARLPNIVLNANVAAISSSILQLQEDYSNPTGGAGAKLLAPIYRGGALQAQVEIRTLEQKEAIADYARLALRALGGSFEQVSASLTTVSGDTTRAENSAK